MEQFVRVVDGEFVVGCAPFYPAGWNQWEAVEAGSGANRLTGASIPSGSSGPGLIRDLLDEAQAAGLNVMRFWTFAVDDAYAQASEPGVYNEAIFEGLDYVVDAARQRGIRVLLSFTSMWTNVGGVPQYVGWAGKGDNTTAFFTDEDVKGLYKSYIKTVLTRTNTVNGRVYAEDPTIFAWNLINEPRCSGCPNGTIANWVAEMAPYVKSIDPNHLLTVGEDGFFSLGNLDNPGGEWPAQWAAHLGQDFVADHASPAIDFASFHSWPDNWQEVSVDWQTRWIAAHAAAGTAMGKPVLLEEYGKWYNASRTDSSLADRLDFFQAAAEQVAAHQANGSALKGSLFWQFYADGQVAPASEGSSRGLYGIYASDDVFTGPIADLAKQALTLTQQASTAASTCDLSNVTVTTAVPAGAAASSSAVSSASSTASATAPRTVALPTVAAPPTCEDTLVRSLPGTGYDGPNCTTDINECLRGTDDCAATANCINTVGSFECLCWWGYEGNGTECVANPTLLGALADVYWSAANESACDPGINVEYPTAAPGWAYDNASVSHGTNGSYLGSRTNITLEQCQIACQTAELCESVSYNAVQHSCYLKRAQCPVYNFCYDPTEIICTDTESRAGESVSFNVSCGTWMTYYRLDMDVTTACDTFTYTGAASIADPDPDVIDVFEAFANTNAAKIVARDGSNGTASASVTSVATPDRNSTGIVNGALAAAAVQASSEGAV